MFLWFSLSPGKVNPEALSYFSPEQVNSGRLYSQGLRLSYIIGFLLQTGFLLWLVFSGKAVVLSHWGKRLGGNNYWLNIIIFFLVLWIILKVIRLPFTFFSGYYWQHSWGFSTQTISSWWLDYFKESVLDLIITAVGVILLFWIMNRWSSIWWLIGASMFSVWLVVQSFIWPVLIAPMFNKFEPVLDNVIITMVHDLADRAGLRVDQVLVMDASQRTTKANAYFAGLGSTKRIVLYDTLLANYTLDEVEAVIAHEMAHWRKGHIVKGLILGIIGNFLVWALIFVLLRSKNSAGVFYPPFTWAAILLFITMVSFVSSPLQNYFSRKMEVEADQLAVQLTGNVPAAVQLQIDLSTKNRSDLSPPEFIEWFSYTHPPAVKRIQKIREAYSD